jgi:3-deoxy-D-manno-octulosonic-acid transferase
MSIALRSYAAAASAVFPFIKGRLRKGHATGFDERCGIYTGDKLEKLKDKRTFWLHAVSVGEVLAASPFVDEIARSGWDGAVLLSTVTETGARSAGMLMGDKIGAHIYAPWDVPRIAKMACDALAPMAYATVETEVWPNLLAEMKRRGIPVFLLNARISDRTFAKSRFFGLLKEVYGMFDAVFARSDEDARRLSAIGVDEGKIDVTGDMKIDALIDRKKSAERNLPELRGKIFRGAPACFVAGSTHEGEEEIVLDAFDRLVSGGLPEAKLVIAPRHPQRAEAVLSLARKRYDASLFSSPETKDARIVVMDVIGFLFELYGVATAAFIGGSLVPKGGQNILEPAIWGIPVLHGPHMEDFADPASQLDASGGAFRVDTPDEIKRIWRLAAKGGLTRRSGAGDYFALNSGAAARTLAVLEKYL